VLLFGQLTDVEPIVGQGVRLFGIGVEEFPEKRSRMTRNRSALKLRNVCEIWRYSCFDKCDKELMGKKRVRP
jgi:hypothetical protein